MDVQEAVQTAKEYINKIFENENIQWVDLEEIVFDDASDSWKVTIGFLSSMGPRAHRVGSRRRQELASIQGCSN